MAGTGFAVALDVPSLSCRLETPVVDVDMDVDVDVDVVVGGWAWERKK
jgi:hypothetical protein